MNKPCCEELFPNWKNANEKLKSIINNNFRFNVDWAIYDKTVSIGFINNSILVFIPTEYRHIIVDKYNEFVNTVFIESGIMDEINRNALLILTESEIIRFKSKLECILSEYQSRQKIPLIDVFLKDYLGVDILSDVVFKITLDDIIV